MKLRTYNIVILDKMLHVKFSNILFCIALDMCGMYIEIPIKCDYLSSMHIWSYLHSGDLKKFNSQSRNFLCLHHDRKKMRLNNFFI